MKLFKTLRNFVGYEHEAYVSGEITPLILESSEVGNYSDSFDLPGSSYLWVGQDHHLNREEVKELIDKMQYWLDNKCLLVR